MCRKNQEDGRKFVPYERNLNKGNLNLRTEFATVRQNLSHIIYTSSVKKGVDKRN